MKKSFNSFLESAFPTKNPLIRHENGLIHNLIKWIALRFSYFFYRIGISANFLDISSAILLIPTFYLIYFSVVEKNFLIFIIGYSLVSFFILVEFIDGPLAKSNKYTFAVGDNLDNLCPDIIKFMSLLCIGLLTENDYFFILSVFTAMIISNYVNITTHAIEKKYNWINKVFMGKMSLNGFRLFVCFIVPILTALYILDFQFVLIISKLIIFIYLILSLTWIIITFQNIDIINE